MSLRKGELVLGRFVVEGPLPPWGETERVAAKDDATGAIIALHQPAPQARIRPGARERFLDARRTLPMHPAIRSPLAQGEHSGRSVAAHSPADPFPARLRLSAEDTLSMARWLAPAAAAAGDALGGQLRPIDLSVDEDGVVGLQPAGIVPQHSIARPDPFVPPGAGTPAQGALYGLGLILFEAVTGESPFSARITTDLERQQLRPPRPSEVRPDLPTALDAFIAGLISPDPTMRTAAIQAMPESADPFILPEDQRLPEEEPTEIVDAPIGGMVATKSPVLAARRDVPLQDWVVVAKLDGAPTTMVRRLAAMADVPADALLRAAQRGLPVPIAGGRSEAEARENADLLERAGIPLGVQRSAGGSAVLWVGLIGALGGGGVLGLMALAGLLRLGLGIIELGVLGTLFVIALAAAAVFGMMLVGRRASDGPLREGHTLLQQPTPQAEGPSQQMAARIQNARKALLTSELSEAAQVDLLSALDDLEGVLPEVDDDDEMARVQAAVDDIAAAARATVQSQRAHTAVDEASKRAKAAMIAAREMKRGG
ncbi:MAG: hypothetical protein AAFV53_06915 [Myxococcota bacterium]